MQLKAATPTSPVEVTGTSFGQEVLKPSLPVLLDCRAPRCGPCRMMAPVREELATSLAGTVKVAKLHVDQTPATAGRLGIRSIPTLLLFREGRIIGETVGAAPADRIKAAVLRRPEEQ